MLGSIFRVLIPTIPLGWSALNGLLVGARHSSLEQSCSHIERQGHGGPFECWILVTIVLSGVEAKVLSFCEGGEQARVLQLCTQIISIGQI